MSETVVDTSEHDEQAGPAESSAAGHAVAGGHETSTGISNNKLAMWVFLASDCLLFGALISTYLLLRHRTPIDGSDPGPGPEDLFDIPFTSVSSFVLLMSSLTMALAVGAVHRGEMARCRTWLVTTALLGSVFIGGQVYEFTAFYNEGLGYTTNIFGSAFYTMTGFHGVHVTVGIIFLMSLFVLSLRNKLGPDRAETVEIFGLYWHFVDIVWILIFTIVYLVDAG